VASLAAQNSLSSRMHSADGRLSTTVVNLVSTAQLEVCGIMIPIRPILMNLFPFPPMPFSFFLQQSFPTDVISERMNVIHVQRRLSSWLLPLLAVGIILWIFRCGHCEYLLGSEPNDGIRGKSLERNTFVSPLLPEVLFFTTVNLLAEFVC